MDELKSASVFSDAPPDEVRSAIDTLLSQWRHVKHRDQRWQLEKAQLRARILQLEAESRRHQQIRLDLVRRVKLLEHGLVSERKKYLAGAPPSKFTVGSVEKRSSGDVNMQRRFRSLPRNFFSKDDLTNVTPGRAFLREYLIELGYLDEVKALDGRTSRHQQDFVDRLKKKGAEAMGAAGAETDDGTDGGGTSSGGGGGGGGVGSKKISFAKPSKKVLSSSLSDALVKESIGDTKIWKTAASLRSHMDGVRCLAFHNSEAALLSGGEDGTMKLWHLGNIVELTKSVKVKNSEPAYTFRGHRGMVTSIYVDETRNQVYSTGVDGCVMFWQLPPLDTDPYGPEGCALQYSTTKLTDHTDAVWSICGHSSLPVVVSASADGTVGVWNINTITDPQRVASITHGGGGGGGGDAAVPCVARVMEVDAKKMVIGYTNGELALCDIETGQLIRAINSGSRVTDLVAHPTLNMTLSGHGDANIRLFDFDQGACVGTMQAHRDVVTSVSLDPSGLYMASSSHDESIRFWDVAGRRCIQDLDGYQTHRRKYDEAIHVVCYHPCLPLVASGGGDSIVKVYQ